MKEKIKNFIKNNWLKIVIWTTIIIVISGAFYWFELRPILMRQSCVKSVLEQVTADNYNSNASNETVRLLLDICLLTRGLGR